MTQNSVERDEATAVLLAEALEQWRGPSGFDLASWQDQAAHDEDFLPLLELMCTLETALSATAATDLDTPAPDSWITAAAP